MLAFITEVLHVSFKHKLFLMFLQKKNNNEINHYSTASANPPPLVSLSLPALLQHRPFPPSRRPFPPPRPGAAGAPRSPSEPPPGAPREPPGAPRGRRDALGQLRATRGARLRRQPLPARHLPGGRRQRHGAGRGGPGGSGEKGLGVALPGCRGDGCEDGCCVGWRVQGAWKCTQLKRVEAGVVVVVCF